MTLLSPPFLLELHSLKVDGSARRPLLSDISFTRAAGERLAVIGPNGCGKSTLLKTLVGERRIAGGEIRLAGQRLSAISGRSALTILPSTMRRIRGYALRTTSPSVACRTTLAQDSAIIRLAIADVGLAHRTHARIGTLSGGERQRAALARALAQTPQLLLLDEPTNHLDPLARARLLMLVRQKGIAPIAVLHDLPLVDPFADRVLVLREGQTVICAPPIMMTTFGLESYTLAHPQTGLPVRFFAAPSGA
ncbi:ATP-binding cassette domain-containing protein [Sodalis sp.]|uniref:ATP-binding cassette domain-containing protein n=1 Tax=Sodalis sp. (in: enterobacteria) TaxID=1898979 RepID=UPI0038737454